MQVTSPLPTDPFLTSSFLPHDPTSPSVPSPLPFAALTSLGRLHVYDEHSIPSATTSTTGHITSIDVAGALNLHPPRQLVLLSSTSALLLAYPASSATSGECLVEISFDPAVGKAHVLHTLPVQGPAILRIATWGITPGTSLKPSQPHYLSRRKLKILLPTSHACTTAPIYMRRMY